MRLPFDPITAAAVFTLPESGGIFDPGFLAYLRELGRKRPSVLLFFPPKAAGTYLRAAAIDAAGGQLMRIVHAFGGREPSPYLPIFIRYFQGDPAEPVMVSHAHMQGFPVNLHLLEALDLRPVIMLRSVPDMLISYLEMLNSERVTPELWLNSMIPEKFLQMDFDAQADFIVDMLGPWYASYFATWLDYAREAPSQVCVLRYPDFIRDPVTTLETILRHSRVECPRARCAQALEQTWNERGAWRFNKGKHGRGADRFRDRHLERLESFLFRHYDLEAYRSDLLPQAA